MTEKSKPWQREVFFGAKESAKKRLLSDVEWVRRMLDKIERSVEDGQKAGRGASTTTESLFQGLGTWDTLVEMERLFELTDGDDDV